MSAQVHLEHLEQVRELNRAFLALLQSRALTQRDCLGLPAGSRALLCAADAALLDNIARFPHALFQVRCDQPRAAATDLPATLERDASHHDLVLSVLWAVRHTSRQSPSQARLLFGLDTRELQFLRALGFPEVERLSSRPDVLGCAFAAQEWVWRRLLTDTRPESRRQLALIALQPRLDRDWPQRRAPRPAL
jgi:hypothetical protein